MPNKRVTQLDSLSAVASGDFFYVVDVSDIAMSDSGTSKKVSFSDLIAPLNDLFYARNNPSGYTTQSALNDSGAAIITAYQEADSALSARLTTIEGVSGSFALTASLTAVSNRVTAIENGTGIFALAANLAASGAGLAERIDLVQAGTGNFITAAALNTYATQSYVQGVSGAITTARDAALAPYAAVDASFSGRFTTLEGLTGSFVRTSQTGVFATTDAVAAGYYPLASGNALNTATGNFVTRSETGAFGGAGGAASGVNYQKTLTLFAPQSGETLTLFYTKSATNFMRAASVLVNASGVGAVNWNLKYAAARNAAGANLLASDFRTDGFTTAQTQSSFESSVAADNFIWLNISSISGIVDQFHLTLDYI